MTKKETGKKIWTITKEVVSTGVGLGTGIVTATICATYAPEAAASKVAKVMFEVGTHGLATVTGAVAKDLARQEIDAMENGIKLNILAAKQKQKKSEVVA